MNGFETSVAILASPGMETLAQNVVEQLPNKERYVFVPVTYKDFNNGELKAQIHRTIRSKKVYFFHGFEPNPNIGLMKLFIANNAIRLASAKELTLVLPYLPYMRQDRKDGPREPITARVVADLLQTCPIFDHLITFDMHVEQEVGFFDLPVDNIPGRVLHAEYLCGSLAEHIKDVVVVAPDFGGSTRAKRFAQKLGDDIPVGILEKERKGGDPEILGYIGESVEGKNVILYDDMGDTCDTLIKGMKSLNKMGARTVTACITHPIFSEKNGVAAEQKLAEYCEQNGGYVICTDTIQRSAEYQEEHSAWLTVLPIDSFMAKVIDQSERNDGSLSSLF